MKIRWKQFKNSQIIFSDILIRTVWYNDSAMFYFEEFEIICRQILISAHSECAFTALAHLNWGGMCRRSQSIALKIRCLGREHNIEDHTGIHLPEVLWSWSYSSYRHDFVKRTCHGIVGVGPIIYIQIYKGRVRVFLLPSNDNHLPIIPSPNPCL